MKIEDATHPLKPVQGTKAPGISADGFFDESELSFLSLLNTMKQTGGASAPEQGALDLLDGPVSEEKGAEKVKAATELSKASLLQEINITSAQPTSSEGELSLKEVRKELEALDTDLTKSDVDFLKTISPPGFPQIQTVPLQNLIPAEEASGEYDFTRMPVSKGLASLLEKAYKTGQPVRVELDSGSSVILKIRQGKVSAEFLTADQATALYMKQHLAELKSRMEAKNLPVGTLDSRKEDPPPRRQQEKDTQRETAASPTRIES